MCKSFIPILIYIFVPTVESNPVRVDSKSSSLSEKSVDVSHKSDRINNNNWHGESIKKTQTKLI